MGEDDVRMHRQHRELPDPVPPRARLSDEFSHGLKPQVRIKSRLAHTNSCEPRRTWAVYYGKTFVKCGGVLSVVVLGYTSAVFLNRGPHVRSVSGAPFILQKTKTFKVTIRLDRLKAEGF